MLHTIIGATKVEGDNVPIDINYPQAGLALDFDNKVVSVREATKEEIGNGHAHSICAYMIYIHGEQGVGGN